MSVAYVNRAVLEEYKITSEGVVYYCVPIFSWILWRLRTWLIIIRNHGQPWMKSTPKRNYTHSMEKKRYFFLVSSFQWTVDVDDDGVCDRRHVCSISSLLFLLNVNSKRTNIVHAPQSTHSSISQKNIFFFCISFDVAYDFIKNFIIRIRWNERSERPLRLGPMQMYFHGMGCTLHSPQRQHQYQHKHKQQQQTNNQQRVAIRLVSTVWKIFAFECDDAFSVIFSLPSNMRRIPLTRVHSTINVEKQCANACNETKW